MTSPTPSSFWTDETSPDLHRAQKALFLAALDHMTENSPPSTYWLASAGWTCDGGAMAAHLIALGLGVPSDLHAGLYWHSDVELRADLMGEIPPAFDASEEEWAEWDACLEHVRSSCMDEHHHWTVLWPSSTSPVLFDPNGEVRNEPHLQYLEGTEKLYTPISEGPWSTPVYDPGAPDIEAEAEAAYPGILAVVSAALASVQSSPIVKP